MTSLDTLRLRRTLRTLLAPAERPGTPGASIGLLRDGRLELLESAGLASIELGVPIGPETSFRIASVSKQFTCAAILLLEREGRLATTDEVRKYIPELPDFGHPITLANCMRNTSGLRDMLELMRLGGVEIADLATQEDLFAAICRSTSLNFTPGSRFLYCNSGFLLLGRVVERVSGQPLADFLQDRILGPAGMAQSRHTPSLAEPAPGLASGYLPAPQGFRCARHGFALGGEGGMVSSVQDLALWLGWLARHPWLDQSLRAQAAFPDGRLNGYAHGVEVRDWRGLETVSHGGLWPGYKACLLRAPARDVAVIVLANHAGMDPHHMAHQALEAALDGAPGVAPRQAIPASLAPYAGRWVAERSHANFDLSMGPGGVPMVDQHGMPFVLEPLADGRWAARRAAFDFILQPAGEALRVTAGDEPLAFHRAPEEPPAPVGLRGHYHAAELDADWTVNAKDGRMTVTVQGPHRSVGPWPLEPIAPDLLRLHAPGDLRTSWFDMSVRRNAAGEAMALEVNGARARKVMFSRLG